MPIQTIVIGLDLLLQLSYGISCNKIYFDFLSELRPHIHMYFSSFIATGSWHV
jgi:hypothetical protein